MRTAIFLLVVALSAIGCNKKAITYTIEGVISDQSLGGSLNGATVELYSLAPGVSSMGAPIATATTGSDGRFSFTTERGKVEKYIIKVKKTLYFDYSVEFTTDQLEPNTSNTYNTSLYAKSWVKLRFINFDGVENLHYVKQDGKEGCSECCTTTQQWLYGVTDTSIYCINDGNTLYSIYYWVEGGDHGPESVTTTAFDTTDIVVSY